MITMMIGNEDRHGDDGDLVGLREDVHREALLGWGVVPRMAPPPSQGG